MSNSDAAILEEISRLSGAINRHKTIPQQPPPPPTRGRGRGRARGVPPRPHHFQQSYRSQKPAFTDYVPNQRPGVASSSKPSQTPAKEVIIDGVAFRSNGKTLVRKTDSASGSVDSASATMTASTSEQGPAPTAPAIGNSASTSPTTQQAAQLPTVTIGGQSLVRTRNGLIATDRFKISATSKGKVPVPSRPPPFSASVTGYSKRAHPGRNLTLNKTAKQPKPKPKKYEKQCKHFVRTGMCGRGGTCRYQHDPQKIALCPLFLAEKCPFKERPELCALSHDPIPERTPICTRFNTTGDCYKGPDCLYPHIRVGPKKGICRDFAVLGYCDKGALCEASHLRECPDFAETGVCKKMGLKGASGCKLPHVIRANQQRVGIAKVNPKPTSPAPIMASTSPMDSTVANLKRKADDVVEEGPQPDLNVPTDKKRKVSPEVTSDEMAGADHPSRPDDSNEYISLTFLESDEEEEEEDDEEGGEEDDDDDDDDDVAVAEDSNGTAGGVADADAGASTDAADEEEVMGGILLDDDDNMN